MKDVKSFIEKYTALIPLNGSISIPEAERRATEFLSAMAVLADLKHEFSHTKIGLLSTQTAVYAEQFNKADGGTVTENKLAAESSKPYTEAREDLEAIENDITYIKTYYDIFNNCHIMYRNLCKENA